MRVREYMTTKVMSLNVDGRLLDAALFIRRTGKRHIPVVDEEGRVVGIISDRDVSRLAPSMLAGMTPEEYNQVFEATPLTMAMTKDPICVGPDDSIRDAVLLFYTKKVGALPVIEEGRIVGILTVTDMLGLLNELVNAKETKAV
ncbi:MAG: CBS domain-containing protein [Acidobacteria bacterium]|nr:CBS domain-containing protein [Acidobacteriota bacterium]